MWSKVTDIYWPAWIIYHVSFFRSSESLSLDMGRIHKITLSSPRSVKQVAWTPLKQGIRVDRRPLVTVGRIKNPLSRDASERHRPCLIEFLRWDKKVRSWSSPSYQLATKLLSVNIGKWIIIHQLKMRTTTGSGSLCVLSLELLVCLINFIFFPAMFLPHFHEFPYLFLVYNIQFVCILHFPTIVLRMLIHILSSFEKVTSLPRPYNTVFFFQLHVIDVAVPNWNYSCVFNVCNLLYQY